MSVLVIGGTGFIGSRLARRLVQRGERVVLFDIAPDLHAIRDLGDAVAVERGDIVQLSELLRVIKAHRVRRIVHLACLLGDENDRNPARALKINCIGTNNVFEAARLEGIERVVWASSTGVYGVAYSGKETVDESDAPQPVLVYGACKALNEAMAEHYYKAFGVNHVAIRPNVVYGPDRLRGASMNMQDWIINAARGKPITIPAAGMRNVWCYVEDVAHAFELAVVRGTEPANRILNTGGDYRSHCDLARILKDLIPGLEVDLLAGDGSHIARPLNALIDQELGFQPRWMLEDGVKATVEWARNRTLDCL